MKILTNPQRLTHTREAFTKMQLIIGIIVGIIIGWFAFSDKSRLSGLIRFNKNKVENRKKHLDAVLALAARRAKITNDDVQRELKVSDATATRYLETLVEFGQLTRVGQRGQSVYYKSQMHQ